MEYVGVASSYTVEVCADAGCSRLVERLVGVTGTRVVSPPLPRARLHWRVTAVSASGLDGRPAPTVAVEIASDAPDLEPPTVVLITGRPGAASDAGTLAVAPGESLRLLAHDDASGVDRVRYRWNEGEWRTIGGEWLLVPDQEGVHRLDLEARDRAGRSSPVWTVEVRIDGHAPPAPTVRVLREWPPSPELPPVSPPR